VKQWSTLWPYTLQWEQGWLGLEVVASRGLGQTFFQCDPPHLQHLSSPPYSVVYDEQPPPGSYLGPLPFCGAVINA